MPHRIFLCADDYALTDGVSGGIEELAALGRLSATSALVTTRHWPVHGRRVADLSMQIAVGLHLNLTLGQPLGRMRTLAPAGQLPAIGRLVRLSLRGAIDQTEIRDETLRQLQRFADVTGRQPDFVDGHQHAHALPGVRNGVLAALSAFAPRRTLLVRDPSDRPSRIVRRRAAVAKSLTLSTLSAGFGPAVRRLGFPTNDGFSGVSSFARTLPYVDEFTRFLSDPGPRHLVMCHPGHPDQELRTLYPVVERRQDEFAALMALEGLPALLWHPAVSGGTIWIDEPAKAAAA